MSELVPGGNTALPSGAWTFRVPGPFDVSALITDDDGKVRGDADFVFFNQPTAPGARLHGDTLTLDPARLRTGASRVTLVVSPADPGTQLARLPTPTLQVTDPRGHVLTRFTPAPVRTETVLLLAEVYRRAGAWKVRALGQGYADGLAGLARDFGVDVTDDGAEDHTEAVTRTGTAGSAGTAGGARRAPAAPVSAAPPRPVSSAHAPDPDGFLALVNHARAQAGSPPVVLDPRLTSAARAHAAAMAAAGKLGVGDGVSVFQRVTAAGFAYLAVGEHLVSGPRTHAEFVEYCLSGADTLRTVQDPVFTHVGVARADAYWTAVWASPLTPAGLDRMEAEVLELTNRERIRAGLGPLAADGPLARAARAYCVDMAARAFYSHTSPEGTQPWDRAKAAGSVKRSIGENIACGQRSAAEVVEGWMNSPGHRANILKADFTHLGVGFAGGGPSGTYWTQLFGA
ncbi:CAP domain-containing protein [Streptomyces acidiscabies]|uniref:CAP domain-containing protein n=1 Tax=Streptomyces acidiscabies TaxID=42234 RepID=UPI00073EC9A0|nr:CAP domain-containing protein [Streptomyces acidiscabies]GAQ54071.1 general stress protein 16U [Streptomyces acidiscabies]